MEKKHVLLSKEDHWVRPFFKKYKWLLALVLFTSCSSDIKEVKSGEMKHIPFSKNYAIGTDSAIVIIDRGSGKILNVINRQK